MEKIKLESCGHSILNGKRRENDKEKKKRNLLLKMMHFLRRCVLFLVLFMVNIFTLIHIFINHTQTREQHFPLVIFC